MIRGIEGILMGSEEPRKLAMFYKDRVGLKLTMEMEVGDKGEEAFEFAIQGRASLFITHHSKVKGKNVKPERIIINFEVDDIKKEVARLKKTKVKLVQDIYHIENYGQIATFEDADGNFFQFVQVRPN